MVGGSNSGELLVEVGDTLKWRRVCHFTPYLDDCWATEVHGPTSVHWRGSLGQLS